MTDPLSLSPIKLNIRRWYYFTDEDTYRDPEAPKKDKLRMRGAIAAAISNPFAGKHFEDLSDLIASSEQFGAMIAQKLVGLFGKHKIESYGKACLVGSDGEFEHGKAMLTTKAMNHVRDAVGGKAWISSTGKVALPGAVIDVPLAHKIDLPMGSHQDTLQLYFGDGPRRDELIIIVAAASSASDIAA